MDAALVAETADQLSAREVRRANRKARHILRGDVDLAHAQTALEGVTATIRQVMDQCGLEDRILVNKYLKPALRAKETQFFAHKGTVIDSRDTVSWQTRTRALDMAFQLKGSYAPRQAQVDLHAQFSLAETIRAARERANAAMGLTTGVLSVSVPDTLGQTPSDSRLDQ